MVRGRRAESSRIGVGFAPAHVTGLFVPRLSARDPRARGSIGAGLVLDVGVNAFARWFPVAGRRVVVRADTRRPLPITEAVVRQLSDSKGGRLEIELVHQLPIGQGFGMSAAGALAAALATGAALGLPRQQCIEVAHLADLLHAGGLGGVAAILGGGLEMRRSPGVPPWGDVQHRTADVCAFVGAMGAPLPSKALLTRTGFLDRVRSTGTPGLRRLFQRPSLERFLEESTIFGEALGLAPDRLRDFFVDVRAADVACIQAMFGRSFLAIPRSPEAREHLVKALERRCWPAIEVRTARRGAGGRRSSR
jgi:pantoate kinase